MFRGLGFGLHKPDLGLGPSYLIFSLAWHLGNEGALEESVPKQGTLKNARNWTLIRPLPRNPAVNEFLLKAHRQGK